MDRGETLRASHHVSPNEIGSCPVRNRQLVCMYDRETVVDAGLSEVAFCGFPKCGSARSRKRATHKVSRPLQVHTYLFS